MENAGITNGRSFLNRTFKDYTSKRGPEGPPLSVFKAQSLSQRLEPLG